MTPKRFEPSLIKNKIKREDVARKQKKAKRQEKLQKRLARAKAEAADPLQKKKRLSENVPRTLDNTREYDPSILTAPVQVPTEQSEEPPIDESMLVLESDPFADYFRSAFESDSSKPPRMLITTSFKASKTTYDFCEDLTSVIPGAEFISRKKGKGFEMGNIASWSARRGYGNLLVVNEDMKRPNAITIVHLPNGPTAYFKLSSVQLVKQITGHARPTSHYPELVLNNFTTRLGLTIGRMFQTLFPPIPEFQGRQVVTLHNQRDFLFFRRHRYAFRSTEKAALQEIGPRFTLKLRWLKKGLPIVLDNGRPAKPPMLAMDEEDDKEKGEGQDEDTMRDEEQATGDSEDPSVAEALNVGAADQDEYIWMWKPELETTRRTFFL